MYICSHIVIRFFNLMVANQIYNIEGKVRGLENVEYEKKEKEKEKEKEPNRLLFNFFAHGIAIAIIIS